MTTQTTRTEAAAFALDLHLAEDEHGFATSGRTQVARYVRAGDTLWIITETLEDALEQAFTEANVGRPYVGARGIWTASYRNRDGARSLSVGDAIVVNGEGGFVVDRAGFRPMTADEIAVLAASR